MRKVRISNYYITGCFDMLLSVLERMIENGNKHTFKFGLYKFRVKHNSKTTSIKMEMDSCFLSTGDWPLTKKILDEYLPSIFKSKCFNDGELPFRLEVKNTESGHLFEHILLEYLCDFKIKSGIKKAVFVGETAWNWKKEKRGIFNITVSATDQEKDIFYPALRKSVKLFNYIIENGRHNFTLARLFSSASP